uniref:Interleukin 1 receptor accessory protein n=1 Tax=Anas platyrhynchos platyrhynchos TaxID=8840 RepID=A0A493U1S3_ANAPP
LRDGWYLRASSGTLFFLLAERCDDWGVDTMKQIQIYDGEPAKIKCPLFETFLKYNYSTAHSAGLTLIWYRIGQDRDLEEPINFRLPDNRISKEKDTLWFWPALLNDTGNYTCMLRNTTYCSKVAFPLEVVPKDQDSCVSHSIKPTEQKFYLEHANEKIICPDIDGFFPASVTPTVKWYQLVDGFNNRYPQGPKLVISIVRSAYEGNYTCIVTFKDHGRTYNLTRTVMMKVVGSPNKALPPQFTSPNEKVIYELEAGKLQRMPAGMGRHGQLGTEALLFSCFPSASPRQALKLLPSLGREGVCLCRFAIKQLPLAFLSLLPHPCAPQFLTLVLLDTTEAVFDFIQRSRRMIVVLSPDYLTEKSISLLEFKLGIMCQNAIATKLIVVEYRPLQCTHPSILQLKESVSFVTWKGEKSKRSGSHFWKALRLALPLRSLSAGSGWNESCSSQSDISPDPVQRRRSRLKGRPEPPGIAATGIAPRGTAAASTPKAKHRAKHFLACRCCGTYCDGGSRLKRKHRAVAEPWWETQLCKPGAQGGPGSSRPEPPPSQAPALALCQYSDLSNNNDFYVL